MDDSDREEGLGPDDTPQLPESEIERLERRLKELVSRFSISRQYATTIIDGIKRVGVAIQSLPMGIWLTNGVYIENLKDRALDEEVRRYHCLVASNDAFYLVENRKRVIRRRGRDPRR